MGNAITQAGNTGIGDGVSLSWQLFGESASKPPLLMIMGWTGAMDDWGDLPRDLATERQVLIYDHRGIGESRGDLQDLTLDVLARDALALATSHGWERFDLMGISMGGMIAQLLAANSSLIRRLVLGCTTAGGAAFHNGMDMADLFAGQTVRERITSLWRANFSDAWLAANPDELHRVVEQSLQSRRPARVMLAQMGAIAGFVQSGAPVPVCKEGLVIHGTEDKLLPFVNGDALARQHKYSFYAVEGAGHLFWYEDGTVASQINRFLA